MNGPTETAIVIDNLSKDYPGRCALDGISFQVKKGSIHGFLGPNGAGKSTTMKIISGLINPTKGHFQVNGKIGFLPEHPPVYPNMSVYDYLSFILSIYEKNSSQKKNEDTLFQVIKKTGLAEVQTRLIGNLSKGYQQRVGIAQAIVHSPEIIILDEPTVGLDPVAIAEIRSLILELKNEHTILFSSHQLHDVELLCSDITLINRGKIVVSGKMDDILGNLKANMNLKARVLSFDEQKKNELLKLYSPDLESVHFKLDPDQKNYLLDLVTKGKKDLRASLSKSLAAMDAGLLEFTLERGDLEDLFKGINQ